MEKLNYDKNLIPDAKDTEISELQKMAFHMMQAFTKIEEDSKKRKHAIQSAINTISRNLNELRAIEISGDIESEGE